jgi:hypothetical protein
MAARSVGKRFAWSSLFATVICGARVQADPLFWLQANDVAGTPAPLQLFGAGISTGTLYLFGSSDAKLVSGVSFELHSSNPAALSFTAPFTYGPQSSAAWFATGGLTTVTPGLVDHIDTAAIPGLAGEGFGPGSSIGNTMLIGSVGYKFGTATSTSTISLSLGINGVVDSVGDPLSFHVGSAQSPLIKADDFGASATIGTSIQCLCGVSVSAEVFHNVNPGSPGFVDYTFTYFADVPGPDIATFTGIDGPYYVGPYHVNHQDVKPATFNSTTGKFHWDTTGAVAGSYHWYVGATAQGFFGQGSVWVEIIPEPTSAALFTLGAVGFVCFRRR